MTNTSGSIANSYVYDSYGRMLSALEGVPQPFSYTGRELDTESGLYYYRARYYDPSSARFLSEDPIGFNGNDTNMYRYVFNNPVNFIDPDGLQAANPGQAVADAVGLVNGNLNLVLDTQGAKDFIDTLNAAEAGLDPGQQQTVDILIDPQTREVLAVVPANEPNIRDESTVKIRADLEKPRIPETDLRNQRILEDLKRQNLSCAASF